MIFPNRVGRRAAEKAFVKARKRADLAAIMSGLRRYALKTDDRPWCNPATFLNQDRLEDEPVDVAPQRRATAPPNGRANAVDAMKQIFDEKSWIGNEPGGVRGDCDNVEFFPANPS